MKRLLLVALCASTIAPAHAATVIQIGPGNMTGWSITNLDGMTGSETTDPTRSGTSGTFVTGPGTPPSGLGSFRQVVGDSASDEQRLQTSAANGLRLDQINVLSYSTFVHSLGPQASYVSLLIDLNADGRWTQATDDVLYFEPVYQDGTYGVFAGDVPTPAQNQGKGVLRDTWQLWDARNGGWWAQKDNTSGPPLHTLGGYAQLHPAAKIASDRPALRLGAGSGAGWRNFDGNADGVTLNSTTFDFETVPYAPVIVAPADGRATRTTNLLVVGTAEPGIAVTVKEGAVTLSSLFAGADGVWSTGALNFGEGRHTLAAYAIRDGVSSSASAPSTFTVDLTAPPKPLITAPAADTWNAARVTIRGSAEAGATVELLETTTVLSSTTAGGDGMFVFNQFPFADGEHSVAVASRDAAGNSSPVSASVRFFVDALPPVVEITSAPADGPAVIANGSAIGGTAEDNSFISAVHLDFYDVTGRLALSEDARSCTGCGSLGKVSWSDRPTFGLPGYYTVRVLAYDRVGNASLPASRSFVVVPG